MQLDLCFFIKGDRERRCPIILPTATKNGSLDGQLFSSQLQKQGYVFSHYACEKPKVLNILNSSPHNVRTIPLPHSSIDVTYIQRLGKSFFLPSHFFLFFSLSQKYTFQKSHVLKSLFLKSHVLKPRKS
jgi:hypothetical protein